MIETNGQQQIIKSCTKTGYENILRYDEIEIADLCFNEKIIQFNNSKGLIVRGLRNNIASKSISFCDTNESELGKRIDYLQLPNASVHFLDQDKLRYAHSFFKEFINDVNDFILLGKIF